jgi:hypothetical protein
MAMMIHPITKAEYRKREDGLVVVTGSNGVSGVFDKNGRWIEGPRRSADPALCFWVVVAATDKADVLPGNLAFATTSDKSADKPGEI